MTSLDSVLKSRDVTLPTKVCMLETMVFPVVMCCSETWTVAKRQNAKELMLSNCGVEKTLESPLDSKEISQSILKKISPEYSLMLELKLQYFGHLRQRADSFKRP